ncbi:hypothetical protein JTB14_037892 [Gonioctena quinquepunctata]|nr:hypothetical protein JTB14_037892 [Gonioctena quinquepunctata]
MAWKTDSLPNDCNDFASIIENSKLVVLDEPLVLYSSDSSEDDCVVLEPSTKSEDFPRKLDIPQIVFDGNCFQFKNVQDCSEFNNKFSIENDKQVNDGLAVLEILCSHNPLDRPEFVDINNLTDHSEKSTSEKATSVKSCDVLELSDDDDVVFVKEYKEEKKVVASPAKGDSPVGEKEVDSKIRRNPVRNVRNKSRDLSQELLYEEDFAILDASDDELDKKENKPPEKKCSYSTELPKEWPVNVHERPEYNPVTKKIESLDYTIRDIQNNSAAKRAKVASNLARKKPKRKVVRKSKSRVEPEVEKVPIETLKPLVNSTTDMLKNYFVISKKHKDLTNFESNICTFENKLEILKNQALLFSVVNNLDQNEVVDIFKQLNVENETKD